MMETMQKAEIDELTRWRLGLSSSNYTWSFRKEMLTYCEQDVRILAMAATKYSNEMREVKLFFWYHTMFSSKTI